jgi:hypothetical protein
MSLFCCMHTYLIENTILVLSDSQRIKDILAHIKAERNLFKIYEANKIEDLIEVPCFLCFMDASFLTDEEIIAFLSEIIYKEAINVRPKLMVNGLKSTIPKELSKFCIQMDFEKISEDEIKKIILKKHRPFEGKRDLEFQNKIKRLTRLFDNFNEHSKEEYIAEHQISESTYQRDYSLVRKIRNDSVISDNLNRTERIILIFKLHTSKLNLKNYGIQRSMFCETHQISIRTLNRDLKLLGGLINYVFEFDDSRDLYY